MKILKIAFILLPVLISYLPVSAQNDISVLNRIMDKTAKLYNAYPIEKVYLHFDKPYYAVGDTIWFKAYLTIDRHQPSVLSKIIYVDILGPRDSLIQSLKLQVKNGVAWSSFALSPFNYKKGNYRVIAYTTWMNNSDPGYFFNKNITIGDAINNNISTQISLKSSGENKNAKVTAGIFYKDDEGNPYNDKKVNWNIQKDDETIIKGKGVTDKSGFVTINFANVKNYNLDSAMMVTVLDIGSRKQVTSLFSLKSIARPNDIQFFPEGGQLLVGLRTKIAFKAVKPNGLGIDVKGTITNNDNKVVAEFTSSHLGMGEFTFTPADGKNYTVKVTFADGSTATPNLPKIQTGGIVLGLDNSNPDVLRLKLQTDASFFKAYEGKTFYILGKSGGVICYGAQTQLRDLVYSASIPKNKFPTGIIQVTLFSDEGEPLSERIVFIQHNDMLKLTLISDKPSYATRQKVKLNFIAKNNDQPAEGNFSIAVIDDSKVPFDEDAETTILTNLLLTSDIKGYIEKPNYYFNHPDEKTAADLDILLQTQGYRRFSYEGVMGNKFPAIIFAPELGIDISGTLRGSNGIPTKNGNVRLLISDKNYSENAVTDADGRFKFSHLVFSDSSKVVVSARNNPRSGDLVLTIDGDPYQKIGVNFNEPDEILNIDSALSAYLKNSKAKFNSTHTLKEVVIKDTRIVKTVSHKDFSSLASLSSEPDHLIAGSLMKGCPMVLTCISSLAMGMTFDQGNFYVTRDYTQGKRIPAQIFLKGAPIDAGTLSTINVDDIESVEIFTKDELGLINSAYGTNGAIVVNMKKMPETKKISLQELRDLIPQRNEVTFTPKGYAAIRTFYLPRYIGPRASQSTQTDTRSTIYWNPNITTDKTGMASFEYFNADGKGTYHAIIEGLDKDGNLGRQVFRYSVK
jgi:hypothetical protein